MPEIPPDIQQAIATLTGGGGAGGRPSGGEVPYTRLPVSRPPLTPSPGQTTIPLQPRVDEAIVQKFREALTQGAEAVGQFLARYGEQMDAATWAAIYAAASQGPDTPEVLTKPGTRPGGAPLARVLKENFDTEHLGAQLRRGGFLAGVYVTEGPTTWDELTDQIVGWLRSEEGTAALGDQVPADIDKLIEQRRAEGASASEIADLEAMRSPTGVVAERIATMNPGDLLEFNPHLEGLTEIPAGTAVFLGPRAVELGADETLTDVAQRLGVPIETLVAYQQREYGLAGESFDADQTYPGQTIYIPPAAFEGGEQTIPTGPGGGDMTTPPGQAEPPGSTSPPGTTSTTGDPYLDMLYMSGGVPALYGGIVGPKNYSGPYGAYLQAQLPQAEQAYELSKLMDPTANLGSAGVQIAELIRALEAGTKPDVAALMQQAMTDPEYRAQEAGLASSGSLSSVGRMLGTLRGNDVSGTAQSVLYNNPEYIGQKIGEYLRLYPAGSTGVPTFFEYLVKGGL